MGLDMYAMVTKDAPSDPVDFEVHEPIHIHYWRKHPNLHGWMERLYRAKGGASEDFNCVSLQLTAEDLDRLQADIRAGVLPVTRGFFFGESTGEEVAEDLEFVEKARGALKEGLSLIYSSWW